MNESQPLLAAVKPHTFTEQGHTRVDNYFWLRERENTEVLAYLAAENAHCETVLKNASISEQELFAEMKARVKENDESVPYKDGNYFYYNKFEQGKEYALNFRRFETMEGTEELLMDENERAKGQPYYDLGALEVSEDEKLLAYSEDLVGRRLYTIRFRNLQ